MPGLSESGDHGGQEMLTLLDRVDTSRERVDELGRELVVMLRGSRDRDLNVAFRPPRQAIEPELE